MYYISIYYVYIKLYMYDINSYIHDIYFHSIIYRGPGGQQGWGVGLQFALIEALDRAVSAGTTAPKGTKDGAVLGCLCHSNQ